MEGAGTEEGGQEGGEEEEQEEGPQQSRVYAGGHWKLTEKHYFNQVGRFICVRLAHMHVRLCRSNVLRAEICACGDGAVRRNEQTARPTFKPEQRF